MQAATGAAMQQRSTSPRDDATAAERAFVASFPEYAATAALDELRRAEYARLDAQGHVYLDFTGGGLYAASQLHAHMEVLHGNVLGNPHSSNPTSALATGHVDGAREAILKFFNAPADEYVVVLTQNATGALKLVGESYPFDAASELLLSFDNHNSVLGIREFARAAGAGVSYAPLTLPDMRLDAGFLEQRLAQGGAGGNRLFAFPAQSNFSGVQQSLGWIARAQALGWDVLLDAAAYAPTNRLDLSQVMPDFVAISFYKIFGYPTGAGCLIARRAALARLRRPWFSGGTIKVASVRNDRHAMHDGVEAFEDGTVNYLAAAAIGIGLSHISRIGYPVIHERVRVLTGWLLDQLSGLRHDSGRPLVRIYGPLTTEARGGTIALNFFDSAGAFFDHRIVEARANAEGISLRTGSFCNPGGGESAFGLFKEELSSCTGGTDTRLSAEDFRSVSDGKSTGAVRISLGLVSNFADAFRFVQFARGFVNRSVAEVKAGVAA